VFVAHHPRRSPRSRNVQRCQRSNLSTSFTPNSFALNSFVDPHPLTPIASIFYKNIGGRVHQISDLPKSFICNTYGPSRKYCKHRTYINTKLFRCNTYKKQGGTILQAQSFLPTSASTTFRRFALRPPNSPALLLYFLSSVHSSNFRIPQVFYLPLLRKLPGVTQQFPFRNSSPRRVLLTSLLPFFIASCLPELIDTQREAAYLSAPMESFAHRR